MKLLQPALFLALAIGAASSACSDGGLPSAPHDTAANHVGPLEGTFSSIDPAGSTATLALDINESGVIVGRYRDVDGQTHGFMRDKAGQISTIDVPGSVFTVSASINARGDIVGMYATPDAPDDRHGYLLRNGVFTTVDPPASTFTNALGINGSGAITGRFSCGDCETFSAFLYSGGKFTVFQVPGSFETSAFKINESGEIVGVSIDENGFGTLFISFGHGTNSVPLPNGKSVGEDNGGINARGDIVGIYCDVDVSCGIGSDNAHGFLLSGTTLKTIDYPAALSTYAIGVNDRRDVVGTYIDADGAIHGFLLRH